MKRKIVILVVLALLLTGLAGYTVIAANETATRVAFEKVEPSSATVTAWRLNVREGPSTSYRSICKLDEGATVTVIGKLGDWYAIYVTDRGIVGAVDGRYLSFEGSQEIVASKSTDTVSKKDKEKKEEKEKIVLTPDEQKLLDLVNKARTKEGLQPLEIDENLMKVARLKAKDMVENNYFSHQSPTYGSPFDMMRQFDNTFKIAGENIAGNKTVEGAFKAWMASDNHKRNILNPGFTVTGIGVVESKTYGKILVQQFIGR